MDQERISASRSAYKRTKADQAADPLHPWRVLDSLRTLFQPGSEVEPASAPPLEDPVGSGVERPAPFHDSDEPLAVERTFGFLDVCGFTAFCDQRGEHAAVELLTRFRVLVRDVTGRRGVRVAKWLGDGVMLVSTEPGPMVAAVAELVTRFDAAGIGTHGGISHGPVLLFEGDDYIGRTVNLAARLCEAAEVGEVLSGGLADHLPEWVDVVGHVTVRVAGIGDVTGVQRVATSPEVVELLSASISAA